MYREAMRQGPAGVVMPDPEIFAAVLIRYGCSSLRYRPPLVAQQFSDTVRIICSPKLSIFYLFVKLGSQSRELHCSHKKIMPFRTWTFQAGYH